jgi:hypothetical protein
VKWNGYFSASNKFIIGEEGVTEAATSGQWKSEISNECNTDIRNTIYTTQ